MQYCAEGKNLYDQYVVVEGFAEHIQLCSR